MSGHSVSSSRTRSSRTLWKVRNSVRCWGNTRNQKLADSRMRVRNQTRLGEDTPPKSPLSKDGLAGT
jgi:hypothetical protein